MSATLAADQGKGRNLWNMGIQCFWSEEARQADLLHKRCVVNSAVTATVCTARLLLFRALHVLLGACIVLAGFRSMVSVLCESCTIVCDIQNICRTNYFSMNTILFLKFKILSFQNDFDFFSDAAIYNLI